MKEKLHFAERLKNLIEQSGLTPSSLGREVELSHVTIGNYLDGQSPKSDHLAAIADYFKVSTDYLLGRDAYVNIETLNIKPRVSEADINSALVAWEAARKNLAALATAMNKLEKKSTRSSSTSRTSEEQAIAKRAGEQYDADQNK